MVLDFCLAIKMEGSEDLENEIQMLRGRLKQTQDKAKFWRKEKINQLLEDQNNKHETVVTEMQEQMQTLKSIISSKHKENVVAEKKLEEKRSQIENLKTELEKLYMISQEVHTTKAKLDKENNSLKKDIAQLKKDIDAPTQAKKELEYLNKASEVFSSMLGLEFKKTRGGKIQVIFTYIDEKDPLMAFYFFLQIQGPSRKYVVSDVEPPVDGVDELVAQLNETNNLRQFMIEMRKKFKDTVKDK